MEITTMDKCIKEFSKQSKLGETIIEKYTEIGIFTGIFLIFLNAGIHKKINYINFILTTGICLAFAVFLLKKEINYMKKKNRYTDLNILKNIFLQNNVNIVSQKVNIEKILIPEVKKHKENEELIKFILPALLSILLTFFNNLDEKNNINISNILVIIIVMYFFIYSIMYICKEIKYILKDYNFYSRYILELLPYLCFDEIQNMKI